MFAKISRILLALTRQTDFAALYALTRRGHSQMTRDHIRPRAKLGFVGVMWLCLVCTHTRFILSYRAAQPSAVERISAGAIEPLRRYVCTKPFETNVTLCL